MELAAADAGWTAEGSDGGGGRGRCRRRRSSGTGEAAAASAYVCHYKDRN